MKRTVFGLCALMMCFVFTSCDKLGIGGGDDPVKKIEDLQEKMENEGDDFSVSDWEGFFDEYLDILEEFVESNPSKEEYKEMEKAGQKLGKTIDKLDKKSQKNAKKVIKNLSKDKRWKDVEKKITKLEKKFKSDKNSSDDDEDYDDDNDDYDDDY